MVSGMTSHLATKIVSVIIAVVLWGIVLGSRIVEVTKEIPLELITSSEVVAANDVPDKITFKLSGPKAFLRSILDRREDPIRVNLSGAKPALVTYRFFSDNIRVPIGVKVQSINPSYITIKLEFVKRREVPVRLELRGTSPEGYHVTYAELQPPTVRISGAESRVNAITEMTMFPIDISNLKKDIEREVTLEASKYNVQVESEIPKARIEVEPISNNFRIKNVDIRVAGSSRFRVEPKVISVMVRANAKEMRHVDRTLVYGMIDVTGKPKGIYREPVRVVLPPRVNLLKVMPEYVNVEVF